MDTTNLLTIIVQSGSFMAAFAAISAGVIMSSVTKKFGTGILASGFKTISIGVLFIAIGIIIDAANSYIQIINSFLQMNGNVLLTGVIVLKEIFFVLGTYIIVVGSKKTGDKIESLTK